MRVISEGVIGVLVNRPLTNFKKASEKLAEHCAKSRKFHHDAMEKAMTFIAVMENQALAIDQQLNSERSKQVAENRTKLLCLLSSRQPEKKTLMLAT